MDSQVSTLRRIDARQLATLNGIRALLAYRTHVGAHCPSLFSVEDLGRAGVLRRRAVQLNLWCEWPYGPGGPHPLPDGEGAYRLASTPGWLRDYLPFLRALVTVLSSAVPIIGPAIGAAGVRLGDQTTASVEATGKVLDVLGEILNHDTMTIFGAEGLDPSPVRRAEVGADFRALRTALVRLDPEQTWGGLSPIARPEDRSIVYLCREHVRALEYPYVSIQSATAAAP